MMMLDKPRTLEEVIKIMAETQMSVREIMDQDYLSLSRIRRALDQNHEVILGELLRVDMAQQTAVFKEAVRKVRELLDDAAIVIDEAQMGLRVPEFLLDESELF
jgi:hypothetical protein